MDDLKAQLMEVFFDSKRTVQKFTPPVDMPRGFFFMLQQIECLEKEKIGEDGVTVSDLHEQFDMSMPAVSQMLGALESEALITRNIASSDRRKITVSLTARGKKMLAASKKHMDGMMDRMLALLGEEDTRELIRIFSKVKGFMHEMHADFHTHMKRGE